MKVVIVEDEKLSAEHLSLLLTEVDKEIEVVEYLDTVKGTVEAFNSGLKADLMFLDIHLADGNSFEIFSQTQIEIPIIFTTAFDNYAIQAFKQNSIDYLLKPVSMKELRFALDKFKKQRQVVDTNLIEIVSRIHDQINNQFKKRFLVKSGQSIHSIDVDEVHHFITQESVTFLVVKTRHRYPIDYSLDQLETLLNPKMFFRINRKVILNINSIEKVENYFNGRLAITAKFLEGDLRIVSRERVNDFKKWLDD